MSFFKKVFKGIKKVGKTALKGAIAATPVGRAFSTISGVVTAGSVIPNRRSRLMAAASPASQAMSQSLMGVGMSALPTLARGAGTLARRAGGAIGRNAGTIATVGGIGAVVYDQFGNPIRRKRPRGKGITARELKSFTRVTGLLNKFCKTPPPTKRRSASRGKSCR